MISGCKITAIHTLPYVNFRQFFVFFRQNGGKRDKNGHPTRTDLKYLEFRKLCFCDVRAPKRATNKFIELTLFYAIIFGGINNFVYFCKQK